MRYWLTRVAIMVLAMTAVTVAFVAPKRPTPYRSVLEVVTVRTAHAEACGTKCVSPNQMACESGPANKKCAPFSGGGGGCNTQTCIE